MLEMLAAKAVYWPSSRFSGGHQDVPDLLVQLVGLVLGAVTVNGGKLAVLALGKDHIVLVVLIAAGVVDDLGVVLGGWNCRPCFRRSSPPE